MRKEFYEIPSKSGKADYIVKLVFIKDVPIYEECSCTCIYGSWFRWTKLNLRKPAVDNTCSHIIAAIELDKKGKEKLMI